MSKDEAATAAALLELGEDVALAFQLQPTRGAFDSPSLSIRPSTGFMRSSRSTGPPSRN
ncbi:hypothetical protein ACFQX6_13745 [Streptosporangium lutulentum]